MRCTPAAAALPRPFAAFCVQLSLDWHFLEPRDPESKGVVERLQGFIETSFEPGRRFVNELDYQEQLEWLRFRGIVVTGSVGASRHHARFLPAADERALLLLDTYEDRDGRKPDAQVGD